MQQLRQDPLVKGFKVSAGEGLGLQVPVAGCICLSITERSELFARGDSVCVSPQASRAREDATMSFAHKVSIHVCILRPNELGATEAL